MKPEIKEIWVAALESSEYKQGIGNLKSVDFTNKENPPIFCCLGVLCDLYQKKTGFLKWGEFDPGMHFFGYPDNCGYPPEEVIEWAGLEIRYGDYVKIGESTGDLASFNDLGKSFAEIAQAIKEQL